MQFCSDMKFRIPVWLNCLAWFNVFRADISNPANIYTFQVTNRNRKRCGYVISLLLTLDIFYIFFLEFLMLILNMYLLTGKNQRRLFADALHSDFADFCIKYCWEQLYSNPFVSVIAGQFSELVWKCLVSNPFIICVCCNQARQQKFAFFVVNNGEN